MDEININDVLLRDNDSWLHFTNPHQIIIADKLHDVLPALREIERRIVKNGWHAAGFLSYEAASAFDTAHHTKPLTGFPYLWFGLYPEPNTVNLPCPSQPRQILDWRPQIERETYNSAIEKIKAHIATGRTYQVNYTMQLRADFNTNSWEFFLHLVQNQNRHAAYIDMGRYVICSASPELFFQLDGDEIICRPMKGTITRGRTTAEDQKQSQWLLNSEKNRAENVMIVDMIRNDLGRIAKLGSVHVSELFQVERYPTLWQMTSTVAARTNASLAEIFSALFPCASITGAPKVGTMRIIEALESTPRQIYTGTIGYISPQRKAKFNVAIRTTLIDKQTHKGQYGVGGGILWDSRPADEYAEALLKARLLTESQPRFLLLETIRWTLGHGFYLKERHIARLLDSAGYFGFPVSRDRVEAELNSISATFSTPQRVRLLLDKQGKIFLESTAYQATDKVLQVSLANYPISSNDLYLFHKTTHRAVYEDARVGVPDCDDVLLYNERGELTEFTIGNLVVELNGALLTPPIECGLLAGTFRAYLLETGQVLEKRVLVEELKHCTKVFRVNSIRQWESVEMR